MSSSSKFPMDTVRVSREGDQTVEIALEQLTPTSVARVFSLDPATVWLREDSPGSRAFFPDENNTRFVLNDDVGILICDLVAMGSPVNMQTHSPPSSSARVLSTPSEPSTSGLSHQTQVSAKKTQSCNVKIVQASVKRLTSGKLEFSPQNQTFVDVTEATANLHYVSSAIQRKWGQEYTLVTSDGLKVDDSSGTKGLKFWKVGSRKLYAVKESELREKKRTSAAMNESSSSSDESLITPFVKRKRTAEYVKLTNISSELKEVKNGLEKIFTLTSGMSIPIALRNVLFDTFRCSICQATPMVPPIIFAKCCKYILGCQQCVDTWYRGEQGQARTCPRCRSDRAYVETCRLNGMDDFLTAITPLLEVSDDAGGDANEYHD